MTKIWRQKEWEKEIEQSPDKPLKISPGVVINKPKKKKEKINDKNSRRLH